MNFIRCFQSEVLSGSDRVRVLRLVTQTVATSVEVGLVVQSYNPIYINLDPFHSQGIKLYV